MNQTARVVGDRVDAAKPLYRVMLTVRGAGSAAGLPALVECKRGDLRRLVHRAARRVEVHLGIRRIDDVVAAVEAAGYDIDAIVLT